jgi:hypothetical protein
MRHCPLYRNSIFKGDVGDLVIIANEPAGQVVHYLFREFGRKCGEGGLQLPQPLPNKMKRFIVLSPFKDHVGACFFFVRCRRSFR